MGGSKQCLEAILDLLPGGLERQSVATCGQLVACHAHLRSRIPDVCRAFHSLSRGYVMVAILISLKHTNIQRLIGRLRMNHRVFRENLNSHLPVSRTCTFFKYTITANARQWEK